MSKDDHAKKTRALLVDAKAMIEHWVSGRADNWDGSTKAQARTVIDEIERYLVNNTVDGKPADVRWYNVMVRRSIKLFNSSSFEAASAQEAVDMARKGDWSSASDDYEQNDDDMGPIEWVHAEDSDGDHYDWEETK